MSRSAVSVRLLAPTTTYSAPLIAPAERGVLRRQCACGTHSHGKAMCPTCSKRVLAGNERTSERGGHAVPPMVHDVLRSHGEALDASTRAWTQQSFDHDFSGVRVHTDARAAESAAALQAHAYTVGDHIVFGHGGFVPHDQSGKRLIAHELAHVVQNRKHRGANPAPQRVSDPDDVSEREAHAAAHHAVGGDALRIGAAPSAAVQRDDVATGLGIAGAIIGGGALIGLGIAALAGAFDKKKPNTQPDAKKPPAPGSVEAIAKEQAEQRPLISFEDALKEGSAALQPAFGKTYGQETGIDPHDGYDASEWTEVQEGAGPDEGGRHFIEAKGNSSWVALKHMFANFGKPVPKAGGGTTFWSFDCFEFVEVLHLYARWRSMPAQEFDKKFPKLKIGFFTKASGEWQTPFKIDAPKGKPYQLGEIKPVIRRDAAGNETQTFEPEKIPSKKSSKKLLDEAPIGTQVIWSNFDATRKCVADRNLDFCEAWQNENATKIGPDRYNAFPLGEKDEASIKLEMAKKVVDPVPPGYIEKNLYISAIFYPAAASQSAPPAGGNPRGP
jgi:Domain of unknown function (DUF4157)